VYVILSILMNGVSSIWGSKTRNLHGPGLGLTIIVIKRLIPYDKNPTIAFASGPENVQVTLELPIYRQSFWLLV
jgi:hypothetical protein